MEAFFCFKGVPFGETFKTTVQYYVQAVGEGKCHLRISGDVEWVGKPPLMKGVILREVRKGQQRAFRLLLYMLIQFASGRKKKKGEESMELDLDVDLPADAAEERRRWRLYMSISLAVLILVAAVVIANSSEIKAIIGL